MVCYFCGYDRFRLRIDTFTTGRDAIVMNDQMVCIADVLTRDELMEPGERPPLLFMTCAQCGAAFFKTPAMPFVSAYREFCAASGRPPLTCPACQGAALQAAYRPCPVTPILDGAAAGPRAELAHLACPACQQLWYAQPGESARAAYARICIEEPHP